VDDFAPGGSSQDVQRKHRDADRIFRAQGNRCGRQRMRADGSLCPEKPPRGLILSTGEDIPRGHSCRARVLTVEIAPGDIEPGKLSHCQALARQGVFAAAMSGFICWLAGRYPEVQAYMQSQLLAYRQQALSSGFHRRTPEIIANLMVAIRVFLTFALEEGVVNDEQKVRLEERGWIALGQVAAAQAEHQKDADPVRRFLELLNAALTAGRAHLADREGSAPTENGPGGWGWRRNGAGEWNSMGDRVGWIDGGKVFLDPEASYRAAQAMAGPNGDGIPISPHRLRKRLDERGLLKREGARESLTIRRKLEGRLLNVLCMNLDVLSGPEPDNPDIKAIAPPSSAEKEGFMSGLVSDSMSGSCQIPSETCHQNLPSNLTHTMPEPVQEDQCQECQVFSAEEKQRIKEAIDHRDLDGLPDTLRPIWEENVAACKVSGVDRNRAEELAWLDIRGRLGQ